MSAAPEPGLLFRLFANCVPVRGARRSSICDLQRGRIHLIPNALHEILTTHRDLSLAELLALHPVEEHATLEEYFAFLVEKGLGFWCDAPEAFPELDLSWDAPARVTNAIVDFGPASDHDLASIVRQLDALGCQALQLRFFAEVTEERMDALLAATSQSRLRSIDLLLPDAPWWTPDAVTRLGFRHQRISGVLLHSAPEARHIHVRSGDAQIRYVTRVIDSDAHCGEVHPDYFAVNLSAFTEAQAHNSCLNRKIAVDAGGWIRNCPSMPRAFGHASSDPLAAAVDDPAFRGPWGISRDQVEVCRDCEFRYVCTDCRAHLRDPADPRSKPAKCGYDPYTATWNAVPRREAASPPGMPARALPVLAAAAP